MATRDGRQNADTQPQRTNGGLWRLLFLVATPGAVALAVFATYVLRLQMTETAEPRLVAAEEDVRHLSAERDTLAQRIVDAQTALDAAEQEKVSSKQRANEERERATQLQAELEQLRRLADGFDVLEVFPEARRFVWDSPIGLENSGIVKRAVFTGPPVWLTVIYVNDTVQRVKPDVIVWVLNKDGVVLHTYTDTWLISSLLPGEEKEKRAPCSFAMPESLVFSRWARMGWDIEPAYVVAVGSKYSYDKLMERTKAEIERLNAGRAEEGE